MTIDIDNFVAINDKRPGKEAFRVFGTVTVANPGIEPVLSTPIPPPPRRLGSASS